MTFAFTGYLRPGIKTAYWATQVGINMVGTVPLVGDLLSRILRGGEDARRPDAVALQSMGSSCPRSLPQALRCIFILRRVGPAGP
ncbi:MAG: hypothetical protein MRJ92_01355 [Nitrospira sp.]|nr:hypothetical protein [Nitrospira sp.]